jgi:hypothetical protein
MALREPLATGMSAMDHQPAALSSSRGPGSAGARVLNERPFWGAAPSNWNGGNGRIADRQDMAVMGMHIRQRRAKIN